MDWMPGPGRAGFSPLPAACFERHDRVTKRSVRCVKLDPLHMHAQAAVIGCHGNFETQTALLGGL